MKNADYWRQRARINSDAAHAEANEYIARLEDIYREAVMSVQADLDRWFGRFADNNQITLAEAKKRLTEGELEEFHWTVDKYIKAAEEHGLDPAWQKKLENASARYHISRLEAIQTQIQQQAELVYGNQTDGLDELLRHVADNGYNHAAFDVMKGVGMGWDFAKLDQTRLDAMLKKPWTSDGKTFTDRCWEGKADLIDGIQRELVQSLMRGDSLAKTRDRIADRFNVSKYKAGRLAHTEATYFNAVSTQACYEDLGVEKIEILETLDKHTCEICAAMDGKVIDKKDYQPGVTVPPFHPNCRGTTCPWFDDMVDVGQRIARDNEGEVYYVPPDMTYREWEKTFQEGGEKPQLINPAQDDIIKKEEKENETEAPESEIKPVEQVIEETEKPEQAEPELESVHEPDTRTYKHATSAEYSALAKKHKKNVSKADQTQVHKHTKADGSPGGYVATHNYSNINSNMRGDGFTGNRLDADDMETIAAMRRAIAANELDNDYVLTRYVGGDYLTSVFGIKGAINSHDTPSRLGDSFAQLGNKFVVDVEIPRITKELQAFVEKEIPPDGPEKAFLSTSMLRDKNIMDKKALLFEIHAPKGTHCYVPKNRRESECILGEGQRMLLEKVEYSTLVRKWIFTVRLL